VRWIKRFGWVALGAWVGMHIGAWAADERTYRRFPALERSAWVRSLAEEADRR
jgi:hypothetical protein